MIPSEVTAGLAAQAERKITKGVWRVYGFLQPLFITIEVRRSQMP